VTHLNYRFFDEVIDKFAAKARKFCLWS